MEGPARRPPDGRHLGLLIVEGLLSHRICVASRESVELLGPGDLLRPWIELEDLSVPYEAGWHVEAPTRLAVLDADFSTGVAAWPEIVSALMDRLTLRTRWLGGDLAIASARGMETRLLLALWYCADRWGRVTADGVVIPLPLTHALLAEVIGARRPSVTTAGSDLEEQAGRLGMAVAGFSSEIGTDRRVTRASVRARGRKPITQVGSMAR